MIVRNHNKYIKQKKKEVYSTLKQVYSIYDKMLFGSWEHLKNYQFCFDNIPISRLDSQLGGEVEKEN